MYRFSLCMMFFCFCGQTYSQRSTLNKEDRLFLKRHLESYFAGEKRDTAATTRQPLDEVAIFKLTDELPIRFLVSGSKEQHIKIFNDNMVVVVSYIFINFLREFPQFKRIRIYLNSLSKVYTLIQPNKIMFYHDLEKKKKIIDIQFED